MSTAARIDDLRQRFQDNPRRYFASYANELRKLGAHDEAIALCREYLPQLPGHMSGHIVFGQALFEADRLDEARGVFEQALAQDPENLIALRHLGDIDRRRGDAASARRWYERVLEADPRNDDIGAQLATLSIAMAPPVVVPVAPLVPIDASMASDALATPVWSAPVDPTDPFRFGVVTEAPVESSDEATAEQGIDAAAFEEGLVAPEWPDTSALSDRAAGLRRSDTPPPPMMVDEATAAAFGGGASTFGADDDVPSWLRTPVTITPVDAIPAVTEPVDVAPVAVGQALETDVPTGIPVAESTSVSFADVHPDVPIVPVVPTPHGVTPAIPVSAIPASATPVSVARPVAPPPPPPPPVRTTPASSPAFVTETMGELFVAQGFLDRAVAVYEELVRQRPDEPALSSRLAALRNQVVTPVALTDGPRTVRQRFAALAARRVGVPVSPGARPAAAVVTLRDDVSLDALFGSGGGEADRRAAQIFAEAFKPVSEAPVDFVSAMDRLPAQPPVPTAATTSAPPFPSAAAAAPAPAFDGYFPDPAPGISAVTDRANSASTGKAADDLAEFSAWLKGLGNP